MTDNVPEGLAVSCCGGGEEADTWACDWPRPGDADPLRVESLKAWAAQIGTLSLSGRSHSRPAQSELARLSSADLAGGAAGKTRWTFQCDWLCILDFASRDAREREVRGRANAIDNLQYVAILSELSVFKVCLLPNCLDIATSNAELIFHTA